MKALGFRNHMLLIALLPTTLVAVLLSIIFVGWNSHEVEVALKERGLAIGRQLGTAAEYGIFSGSRDALRKLAEAAQKGDPEILSVSILDERGQLLSRVGENGSLRVNLEASEQSIDRADRIVLVVPITRTVLPVDDIYADISPVEADGRRIAGFVALEISRQRLVEIRNTQTLIGLDIALGGLLLGVWLALRMARGITQPLSHIIDVVERIGRGDLSARVVGTASNTFRSLEQNINAMAERVTLAQEDLQKKIDIATDELRLRKEEAELLARIDVLTGIPNRRAFMVTAEQEILRAQRYGTPLSVALLDLDFFKAINDGYGHGTGDSVLVNRASMLANAIREVDTVGRLGGEEFAILMPGITLHEAVQAIERIREALDLNPVNHDGNTISCTASFGVAEYPGTEPTVDGLLAKADGALYMAKERGRNRVEAAEPKVVQPNN